MSIYFPAVVQQTPKSCTADKEGDFLYKTKAPPSTTPLFHVLVFHPFPVN